MNTSDHYKVDGYIKINIKQKKFLPVGSYEIVAVSFLLALRFEATSIKYFFLINLQVNYTSQCIVLFINCSSEGIHSLFKLRFVYIYLIVLTIYSSKKDKSGVLKDLNE